MIRGSRALHGNDLFRISGNFQNLQRTKVILFLVLRVVNISLKVGLGDHEDLIRILSILFNNQGLDFCWFSRQGEIDNLLSLNRRGRGGSLLSIWSANKSAGCFCSLRLGVEFCHWRLSSDSLVSRVGFDFGNHMTMVLGIACSADHAGSVLYALHRGSGVQDDFGAAGLGN